MMKALAIQFQFGEYSKTDKKLIFLFLINHLLMFFDLAVQKKQKQIIQVFKRNLAFRK